MTTQKLTYTIPEAAEQLSVSPSTLRQLVKDSIVAVRYIGRKPVVEHAELVDFIQSRPSEPTK